jgi:hypothetical protein
MGWLVGWGGGTTTANHRPRLLGTRARRVSGKRAGAPGCQGGRRIGRGDMRPQVIIDTDPEQTQGPRHTHRGQPSYRVSHRRGHPAGSPIMG